MKIFMCIRRIFIFTSSKRNIFQRKEGDVLSIPNIHSNTFVRTEEKYCIWAAKIAFFAMNIAS